jgi:hypothetical protein
MFWEDSDFEILVIDSLNRQNSSNSGILKCKRPNMFENYAIQRNFALGLAKGTWILFLDADERLTS